MDPNTCRKFTSTIEPACRPNLNSLKQKFRTIITAHKKYGLGNVLYRLSAKLLPLINPLSFWLTDFWSSLKKKMKKNPPYFLCFAEFETHHPRLFSHMFFSFSTVTEDQFAKILLNPPSKSCSLDPWPTFLVLDYLDTHFNNQCLT